MDVVRDEILQDRTTVRRVPRKSTLLDIYSRAVDTGTPVGDVVAAIAPWAVDQVDAIGAVCQAYIARKRRLGLLDFDDLLLHWRQALRDDLVGRSLAGRYDHVLVDEYQDVNALQVELLQLLRSARRPDHGGRRRRAGHLRLPRLRAPAPPGLRRRLPRRGDGAPDGQLPLQPAHPRHGQRDRRRRPGRVPRPADGAPRAGPASTPRLVRCADEDHQSIAVCEQILAHREDGTALKEQAVLVRAAHHSGRLEIELGRRGIPFVKYGGLRYLEAAHVKDLLAAFRIADNPRDEVAWFRVLQLLPGVGPAKARRAVTALGLLADGEDAEVHAALAAGPGRTARPPRRAPPTRSRQPSSPSRPSRCGRRWPR